MTDHSPSPEIQPPIHPVYRWIPNLLTLFRLACVPSVVILILKGEFLLAFSIFALAAITDFLDGYLARRWHVVSKFGQIFDPLADKSLLVCSFVTLGYIGALPSWLVFLVIGRDVLILLAGLAVTLFTLPVKLTPSFSSKMNTFSQILLIGLVLLYSASGAYKEDAISNELLKYIALLAYTTLPILTSLLMYITALTTLWSGIEYALYFLRETLYSKDKAIDKNKEERP